jgi:hypothetical protein
MKIGSIKPQLIALREFFKTEATTLRIPSIQRQFVWDAEDIKELVDSIISGYPIGAVIIWEPTSSFPSAPLVGKDYKAGRRYVLDGQQRLTALMLIKNGWQLQRGAKNIPATPISYVPDNRRLYLSSKRGIDLSLIVNATLGDAESLTTLQRSYPKSYKQAIDDVGEKIVNYQLPFYVLRSQSDKGDEGYERIAEIFTRVNSAGVKIGNLEMFLSFFAAAFAKEHKDRIISMHERFSEHFELDLEPIVRLVFSRMGLNQNQITKVQSFRKSLEKLKTRFAGQKREVGHILDRAELAILVTTKLLEEEFGASTTQYIPSQNALLPLFDAVLQYGYRATTEIPSKEKRNLLKWFLVASFNGSYSTSANHKLEEDLTTIRAAKTFPVENLLAALNIRAPHRNRIEKNDVLDAYTNVLRGRTGKEYLMLLDVLLHRAKATDWSGKPMISEDSAVHHIFPREFLKEHGETREEMINCIANLTLISPSVNSEIGETPPDEYLTRFGEQVLRDHLIPTTPKLWKFKSFDQFLEVRLKLIWSHTRSLLEELEGTSKRAATVGS